MNLEELGAIGTTVDGDGNICLHYYHRKHKKVMSVWFDAANVSWLVAQLQDCIGPALVEDRRASLGNDHLCVLVRGNDHAPTVYVQNRRNESAPHGGIHSIGFAYADLTGLLEQLAPLG